VKPKISFVGHKETPTQFKEMWFRSVFGNMKRVGVVVSQTMLMRTEVGYKVEVNGREILGYMERCLGPDNAGQICGGFGRRILALRFPSTLRNHQWVRLKIRTHQYISPHEKMALQGDSQDYRANR